MLSITCKLVGCAPLGFSAPIQSIKGPKEDHNAFEERTWRERMHVDPDGNVFLVPLALKNCLEDVAQFLGERVKGQGMATWTKHFQAEIMIPEPLELNVKAADVPGQRIFVPADGKRGGSKRVWKTFPFLETWSTNAKILVIEGLLSGHPEKVKEYLELAGQLIGLGYFRPRRSGYWGRFTVEDFVIGQLASEAA